MNKVILIGRLTRDADIRYAKNDKSTAIATFSLAVNRPYAEDRKNQTADFINCMAFGKKAEFFERFGKKGVKFGIEGQIQSGSYKNKEGKKIYTTSVLVENVEFAESRSTVSENANSQDAGGCFMSIPDGIYEGVSFN